MKKNSGLRAHYAFIGLFAALLFIITENLRAQQAMVYGYVTDTTTAEKLPGVNIVADSVVGTATDNNGYYALELPPGTHTFTYSFLGYLTEHLTLQLRKHDSIRADIQLKSSSILLDMAVISAGKYEQRISDVTVSIEVMKPAFIKDINTMTMEKTLNYVPGLDILDGQASIRGGSGYSYGAGSRVMVLVDGLPILTEGTDEIKWNALPVENIDQVEVLKGASSSLYGSSALNGVINIRTAYPGSEPQTSATLYSGIVARPGRKEMSWWWDTNPLFGGVQFMHAQQCNDIDLVVGANALSTSGYRTDNYDQQVRVNAKFRHRPQKIKRFTYGLNTNLQWQNTSDFFIWMNADSGAFIQDPLGVSATRGHRINADPWITYYDKHNNKHSLLTRYYDVTNNFSDDPEKDNASSSYYGEYQLQKKFKFDLNLIIGLVGKYGSTIANLYGDHSNATLAAYGQFDYRFLNRVTASLGIRWEYHTLDQTETESGTVIRAGLNYQAARSTFIRASYGQGYRFPTIAEKYTATSLGSLNIFPNPDLQSETGWSTELGVKQGFTIRNWSAFVDAAAFWTEYNNMIEFVFGVYKPDSVEFPTLDDIGFMSQNIGKARINGVDIGVKGSGKIGQIPLSLFLGYTYMNPIDLSSDTLENNILKYRYHHSLKAGLDVQVWRFSFGFSIIYRSFMERIDEAFEEPIIGDIYIFPGMKAYRQENNSGKAIFDLLASYHFNQSTKLSLIVKNLFNTEYMGRPGDIGIPLNFTVQFSLNIP